jgi:hypothetical protein
MTEDKGTVSAEKAARTSDKYEEISGQSETPAEGPDPIIAATGEDKAIGEVTEEPPYINAEYEKAKAESEPEAEPEDDGGEPTEPIPAPAKTSSKTKS